MLLTIACILIAALIFFGAFASPSDEAHEDPLCGSNEADRKSKKGKKRYFSGGPPPCRGYYD